MTTRLQRTADKAQNDKHAKILRDLLKNEENKFCADCKKHDARWSSWNIGCFVCIRCSGIHRSMGTHISRVKSIDLDTWTPEQIANVVKWGNKRVNKYYEANLKPGHRPSEHKIESFIRTKYELKRWALSGDIPDPSMLDDEQDKVIQNPPALQQKPSEKVSTAADLLGGNGNVNVPPPVVARGPTATGSNMPSTSLFDIDFSQSSSSETTNIAQCSQPPKNTKDSILSLFSNTSTVPQPQMSGFGSVPTATHQHQSSLSGVSQGDLYAQPQQQPAFPAPQSFTASAIHPQQSQALFNSQDIWGASTSSVQSNPVQSGADIWGELSSSTTPSNPPKKDAFADLGGWGSFK